MTIKHVRKDGHVSWRDWKGDLRRGRDSPVLVSSDGLIELWRRGAPTQGNSVKIISPAGRTW